MYCAPVMSMSSGASTNLIAFRCAGHQCGIRFSSLLRFVLLVAQNEMDLSACNAGYHVDLLLEPPDMPDSLQNEDGDTRASVTARPFCCFLLNLLVSNFPVAHLAYLESLAQLAQLAQLALLALLLLSCQRPPKPAWAPAIRKPP